MKLSTIIDLINQDIPNIKTHICFYIAIGSAGHMVKTENGVDDLYYHQYPKFLEEMHQKIDMTTFHILIDPSLESPPFMTIDNSKGLVFNNNDMCHHSLDNKHIVYCMREAVTMSVYNYQAYTDITHELHQLNDLAIENNILLVYNDFSGRNSKPLANYFDKSISKHLDHIIYGLGNRGNHGCYIDILHPSCKLAYKLDGSIKVFNPFYMLYNKLNILEEIDTYSIEDIEIITTSIENILNYSYQDFINNFGILRIMYQLMTDKCKEPSEYFIERLDDCMKEIFKIGDYKLCYEQLLIKYSYDLDIIIFLKNIKINKIDLMRLIVSDSNEYNWGNTLKNILDN